MSNCIIIATSAIIHLFDCESYGYDDRDVVVIFLWFYRSIVQIEYNILCVTFMT